MDKFILLALLFITLPLFAEDEVVPETTVNPITATVTEDTTLTLPVTEMSDSEPAEDIAVNPAAPALPSEAPLNTEDTATPVVTTEETRPVEPALVTSSEDDESSSVNNGNTPVMTTEVPHDPRKLNHFKSHWLTSFGFEGSKYETFNDFSGVKNSFTPGKKEIWGGRIGIGGQLYLGAGFFTTSKIEGYYMGTLFSKVLNGGPEDSSVKFAYTKRTAQLWGGDAVQQLGYIFEMKTKNPFLAEWTYLTIEPYVEAGFGYANAYNRLNYSYDLATTDERYRLRVVDQLTNARVGAGINFTSNSGYFLYLRMTQNRYDVTSRKADELRRDNGGSTTSTKPDFGDKMVPVTVYAIGGGYKF